MSAKETGIRKSMSLKRNAIANFIGRALIGLMGFLFVPLYLKYMGAESYGLVGFWAMLAGVFGVLDFGICATLNREMARLSANSENAERIRDLLYTMERINWAVAIVIGGTVILLSRPIAHYWVKSVELSLPIVQDAVFLIGFVLLLQWPFSLYSNGLNGLQQQVLQNIIAVSMTALRSVGVIGVLAWVSPTIEAFFLWQIFVYVLQLIISRLVLWRRLPCSSERPRFKLDVLRTIWRFAFGMTGITFLTMILTNADRIILSKMVQLKDFGYYSLASAVANSLGMLSAPVFIAIYPRLSEMVVKSGEVKISEFYHLCCQIVAIMIMPTAMVLILFSKEIVFLWTKNAQTTDEVYVLVSVLAAGTSLNGLMSIPYALQLAYGWTSLNFWLNFCGVLLLLPLMIIMVLRWGSIGAAISWVLLNSGYILVGIQIMHKKILAGQQWRWYWNDFVLPGASAAGVCVIGRLIIHDDFPPLKMLIAIVLLVLSAAGAAAFSSKTFRKRIATGLISL